MSAEDVSQSPKLSGDDQPSAQLIPIPPPSKPSPTTTVSWNLAPTERNSPIGAATGFVEQFLPTLQFPDQRSAVKRITDIHLSRFSELLNFQPLERVKVKEASAYKDLQSKIDSLITSTKFQMAQLYLKGLKFLE